MSNKKELLTLLTANGFILRSIKVYLVGELVKGGRSQLRIVEEIGEETRTINVKRVLVPHVKERGSKGIPQADYWFSCKGKTITVYDLPEKIKKAQALSSIEIKVA